MDPLVEQLAAALRPAYELERELGGGGMSRVFLAEEKALGRKVVIKVLPPDLGAGFNVDRFRREIKVAAPLQHPHIVPLLAAGQADSRTGDQPLLYYTMPFVEGQSLRARLEREGELPVSTAVKILRDVLDALEYAHSHGVVHRDIKPDNVMLSGQHAVVTDFGVAKALSESAGTSQLTSAGLALGTPAYMAPEQAAADPNVDHRADLYAVGAMAYEMLTGTTLFAGTTAQQVLAAQVTRTPEPITARRPSVPAPLAAAIMRCLEKSPADRWQSAAELRDSLESAVPPSGRTVPVQVVSKGLGWLLPAAVALVLVLVALGTWWATRSAAPAPDQRVVAVLPFRVTGTDPGYGEGMVDLLAAKLTGEGGPRATDPQSAVAAWRRAGGGDLPREAALEVARQLGAGKLLSGSIVGSPNRLTLTGTITDVASGREESRGEVGGVPDSFPHLVDRLAAQLLAGSAGASGHQLDKLTSTSLPALRSYLAGHAAYRAGSYVEATGHFRRAVDQDSGFALAAISLASAAHWLGQGDLRDSALALAERNREILSPRDAAFLDMKKAMADYDGTYDQWTAAAQRLVTMAPDSPEGWYDLGDSYFHLGGSQGYTFEEQMTRAEEAFRRAEALDSTFAAPLEHLVEIGAARGDTAMVRRVAARYFAVDSTGDLADFMRWRVAAALGDTATLERLRRQFPSMNDHSLVRIMGTAVLDGIRLGDAEAAMTALGGMATTRDDETEYAFRGVDLELNLGHPSRSTPYYRQIRRQDRYLGIASPIFDAVIRDTDTALVRQSLREAAVVAGEPVPANPREASGYYNVLCALAAFRMTRGDTAAAGELQRRLERHTLPAGSDGADAVRSCTLALRLFTMTSPSRVNLPAAQRMLDSLYRQERYDNPIIMIMAARVHEAAGDTAGALLTIRKRPYHWNQVWMYAELLLEEARLAAQAGDRAGAIRAYQIYLRLQENAEPSVQPAVRQARAELAKLINSDQ